MPTGLDQSWSFASPAAAKAAGVQVISMYHSHDSSKNMTAADVKAYHGVGIGLLHNWEHLAGAPLNGASQGTSDATEAVRQVKALWPQVGYQPSNRIVIYFSCDRDTTPANYPAIDAYFRAAKAVCAAAGFGIGVYGEADLVTHLHAAGITDAEWQTYAWSRGVLSPDTDFYQYDNGQTLGGASVDFDKVIHAGDLGAWWPPAHTLNVSKEAQPMTPAEIKAIADAVTKSVLNTDGIIPSPTPSKTNPFWTLRSHVQATTRYAGSAASLCASILTRVTALQASVDALRAEVKAAKTAVALDPMKVTGTIQIGGAK